VQRERRTKLVFSGKRIWILPVLLADRSNVEQREVLGMSPIVCWFAMKAYRDCFKKRGGFRSEILFRMLGMFRDFSRIFRQYLIADYYLKSAKDNHTDLRFLDWVEILSPCRK
jgi:hypothetical protein